MSRLLVMMQPIMTAETDAVLQSTGKRFTVEITWPRREGELALWSDLLLARVLKAAEGRAIHPGQPLYRLRPQRMKNNLRIASRAAAIVPLWTKPGVMP